jgi:hypothetical protein
MGYPVRVAVFGSQTGYNQWYTLLCLAGSWLLVRKFTVGLSTMRFSKAKTRLPVPSIISWGGSIDNPFNLLNLGTYTIQGVVEGQRLDGILPQYTNDGTIYV